MKYPQVFLLPILMLADYYLTVVGAVLQERGHRKHFKSPHYELNPVWQESIRRKQWFNLRHLLLVALITSILFALLEFAPLERIALPLATNAVPDFLFGTLFTFFGMIIGRHLSNILIFLAIARRPDEITGEVTMGHSLQLTISAYQYSVAAVPISLVALFQPSAFTIGSLFAALEMFLVHRVWLRKLLRQPAVADEKKTA